MRIFLILFVFLIVVFFYSFFPLKYYSVVKENSGSIDPLLIMALIKVESNFKEYALSHAGAVGLMQVMPQTAAWISEKLNLNVDVNSPVDNIVIGIKYLQYLLDFYDGDLDIALRAYNAGPARVAADNSISSQYLLKIKFYYIIYRILYFWVR